MLTRIMRFLTGLESARIESVFDKEWKRMQAEQPDREEKLEKDLAKAYEQLAKYRAADRERERAALEQKFAASLAPFSFKPGCEKCGAYIEQSTLCTNKRMPNATCDMLIFVEHLVHTCRCGYSVLTKTKDA